MLTVVCSTDLAAQVLGHLNQKRAANTRREDFYLQADAFAVLSEMDFVGIDGEQLSAAERRKGCFCMQHVMP